VRRPPGFGGELALPIAERPYRAAASAAQRGAVRAAQVRAERLSALGAGGGPKYVVRECLSWLPEYECRWLNQGEYECWIKEWHCTYWQEGGSARQLVFRVVG
jgi:hypothetical protein